MAAISDDLFRLITYYGQVHSETGRWIPITLHTVPKGLTELHRIVITRVEKTPGR